MSDELRRKAAESNSKASYLRAQMRRNQTPHPMHAPKKVRKREPGSKAYYEALDIPMSAKEEIEEDLLWGD